MTQHGFGRLAPPDNRHEILYGITEMAVPAVVEHSIALPPRLKSGYNQNGFNACVGASLSMMMSILNTTSGDRALLYNWKWLWDQAKSIDDWPETNPGDNNGTSVRAGFDVLRTVGHELRKRGSQPDLGAGVESNWWASSVDQIRGAIAKDVPVGMGTIWVDAMSKPEATPDGGYRMPEKIDIPREPEGHAWIITGALDSKECFVMPNSWGPSWPARGALLCEVPYRLVESLLKEDGEAGIAVDRVVAEKLGLEPKP